MMKQKTKKWFVIGQLPFRSTTFGLTIHWILVFKYTVQIVPTMLNGVETGIIKVWATQEELVSLDSQLSGKNSLNGKDIIRATN